MSSASASCQGWQGQRRTDYCCPSAKAEVQVLLPSDEDFKGNVRQTAKKFALDGCLDQRCLVLVTQRLHRLVRLAQRLCRASTCGVLTYLLTY